MIRGRKRSLDILKRDASRTGDTGGNSRLAEITARIDAARNVSVVRRPVFDRALDVVAYEIVLGDGPITDLRVESEEGDGSLRLVVNSATDLDIAAISADKPVQLTVSSSLVEAGLPPEIAPEQVMLVLGPGFDPTPPVVAGVEALHALGFRILLDDLVANPQLHSLLRFARGVKVNIGAGADSSFAKEIAILRESRVELTAEAVGSYEELGNAKKLGFERFQGSFLSRPNAFKKSHAPEGQLAALELITLLQNPEADISEVAEVIRRDVSLSYRILKVVNSAQYSLPRPLGSIEEAVMLVGTKKIVSWVGMMNMSGLNNKPSELTRTAMVRARACESLAGHLDRMDTERFYIVGLFSVIEAMLDVPAQQALGSLPLSVEIVDAITSGGGIMGEVLRGVIAYEQGDWARAHIVGIEDRAIMGVFLRATIETDKSWAQISE